MQRIMSDTGTATIPKCKKVLSLDPKTTLMGYTYARIKPMIISVVIPKYMLRLCIP
jgi:hypothetical protein